MNLPNWITVSRILLSPVFIILLLKYKQKHIESFLVYSIIVFIIAVFTDALDGAFARFRHQRTALGSILDPLADKLLLLSAVLLLSLHIKGLVQLPLWVPIIFISRDFILISGAVIIYMYKAKMEAYPNKLGKLTTVCQIFTVIWILFNLPMPNIIWCAAVFFTILSGAVYIYQGSKQLDHFTLKK